MKKLKEYTKEELEVMGYDEIAYIILEEGKKKMKINDLFQKVCDALDLDEDAFISLIADFFEILTTNKKFIMLDDGYWDLRTRHSEKLVIEDEEEDFEEDAEELEEEEETEDDTYYDEDEVEDDSDDDLKDLVIIDEEEDAL